MKNLNDLYTKVNSYLSKRNKSLLGDKGVAINNSLAKQYVDKISLNLFKKSKNKNLKVGIYLKRNIDFIICIFACWKTGATPVPLNIFWTKQHLNTVLNIIDLDIIIAEKKFVTKSKVISLNELKKKNKFKRNDISKLKKLRYLNKNPYIIFTSGSTGIQKAVLINIDGYLDYIKWTKKYFKNHKKLKSLLITSEVTFDIFMGDLAYALAFQTSVYISSNSKNIFEHISLIKKYQIEILYTVPQTISMILDYSILNNEIETLKLVISGGDTFNHKLIKKLYKVLKNFAFYNVYGPTECTINVTAIRLDKLYLKNKFLKISIGKVFNHLKYKLYDSNSEKFNKHFGELLISGSQLMDGYITKNKLEKPFININNINYYKTGDNVKIKNKLIYIYGRTDSLVKIKGYRLNPLEIDRKILKIKEINNSVTLPIKKNANTILVSFLKIEKIKLKKIVEKKIDNSLPYYMIPKKIIYLDNFPIGFSGKIDRKSLIKIYNEKHRNNNFRSNF